MTQIRADDIIQLIELARREDLGAGDVTTALVADPQAPAAFRILVKQRGVFAGQEIAPWIVRAYDPALRLEWTRDDLDASRIDRVPQEVGRLHGPLASLLQAERVFLNFLQRLCGVATVTRAFVDAVAGTRARIFDTRKTTPGWRALERYAVRCGGGCNHREGLFDAVLIKDNHLAEAERKRPAGAVFEMLNRLAGAEPKPAFVEVEADSIGQAEELFKVVGIDLVLLDNFSIDDLRRTVELRDELGLGGKIELEASGGITLHNVREVAGTGVERISVGALTHSAPAVDISLERV